MRGISKMLWSLLFTGAGILPALSQSLELMAGTERVFADIQWLKPLDSQYHMTLFSRSRATIDYDNNSDMFTGAYLNYTTSSGFGGSLVGRISSGDSGADAGIHYFKSKSKFLFYGLASVGLEKELAYSWFSILRFTPDLNEQWKLYTSVELFSSFNRDGHAFSVQRFRLGLERNGYQFGLGLNLSGVGTGYTNTFQNPGLFVRKDFSSK